MSFQAVTWAIIQKTGSPSAKAVLWSLANYANDQWCCWPSQALLAHDSEQSVDSVQERLPKLEDLNLIRRIPLIHSGRKTTHFTILAPSPVFHASLSKLEPLFPRGCSVERAFAAYAATCGNGEVPASQQFASGENDPGEAAAMPQIAGRLRHQMPQMAPHATALERQQEPVMEPQKESLESCERVPLISREAIQVSEQIAAIAGLPDPQSWPPGWCGSAARVDAFLRDGYHPDILRMAARAVMAGRKDPEPPRTIAYFERAFAKARADHERKLPDVNLIEPGKANHAANRNGPAGGHPPGGESASSYALRLARLAAGDLGPGS